MSFVYLHAGTPFLRKGDLQMTLPKMDIPVGIVEWEVFVPERYAVRAVTGMSSIASLTRPRSQPAGRRLDRELAPASRAASTNR